MKINHLWFSDRNTKLGLIWNFSVEPVRTCPCKCPFCYALHGFHTFPNVKNVRKENTDYIMDMEQLGLLDLVAAEVISVIKSKNIKKFRIHESGDLYSVAYAKMWFDVIQSCPETQFNIFTKAFNVVREVPFYQLKNANLFLSSAPGLEIPEDLTQFYRVAWFKDKKGLEDRIPEKKFVCPGNAKQCINCGYCFNRSGSLPVMFNEH